MVSYGQNGELLDAVAKPTWTNSTGALSPGGLEAESLVAGKALGTILMEERLRGFVTTREDMVTGAAGWVSERMERTESRRPEVTYSDSGP